MGLFRKTRQQKLEKYRKGVRATLTLPQSMEHSTGTKVAATAALGWVGLAATSGKRDRKVYGKLQLVPKGVLFTSTEIGEIRILYDEIIRFDGDNDILNFTIPGILLTSGEKILIRANDSGIYEFITEYATGKRENGW